MSFSYNTGCKSDLKFHTKLRTFQPNIAISRRLPRSSRKLPFSRDHIRMSKVFFRTNFAGHVREPETSKAIGQPVLRHLHVIYSRATEYICLDYPWNKPVPILPRLPLRFPLTDIESKLRGKQINGPSLSTLCEATSFEKRLASSAS